MVTKKHKLFNGNERHEKGRNIRLGIAFGLDGCRVISVKFYTQHVHIHWGSHWVTGNKIPIQRNESAQDLKFLKLQCRETSTLQSLSHSENLVAAFQHMNQNYIVQIVLRGADILAAGVSYENFLLVNTCGEMTKATSFTKKIHTSSLLSCKSYQT